MEGKWDFNVDIFLDLKDMPRHGKDLKDMPRHGN